MHKILRIVWEVAGNNRAARQLIEGRAEDSVGMGNSGDGMTRPALVMNDQLFAAVCISTSGNVITTQNLAARASGQ